MLILLFSIVRNVISVSSVKSQVTSVLDWSLRVVSKCHCLCLCLCYCICLCHCLFVDQVHLHCNCRSALLQRERATSGKTFGFFIWWWQPAPLEIPIWNVRKSSLCWFSKLKLLKSAFLIWSAANSEAQCSVALLTGLGSITQHCCQRLSR